VTDPKKSKLPPRTKRMLGYFGVLVVFLAVNYWYRYWSPDLTVETEHYLVESSATPAQTERVGRVAEITYQGYRSLVGDSLPLLEKHPRLKLKVYKDREEFQRVTNPGWAEAFYLAPYCHQYIEDKEPNPFHWMTHEATHQLNHEIANLDLAKCFEEGLAEYIGTSRIVAGKLQPGVIDTNTYPIWWLTTIATSGDMKKDLARGNFFALVDVLNNTGPSLNSHVNLYYLHWWSLTHFLLHGQAGTYRSGYWKMLAAGGTQAAFEKHIGPVADRQAEWYKHLRQLKQDLTDKPSPPVELE
jgi:hypothetical protein